MDVRSLVAVGVMGASLLLTGCTASGLPGEDTTDSAVGPTNNQTVGPTPGDATPSASLAPSSLDDVNFTFHCWTKPDATASQDFATMSEVWADPTDFLSCRADKHGRNYTDTQRRAVAVAGTVLPLGLDQLDSLYSECAIRDSGYLSLGPLAENQKQDVSAFLVICPDHPRAAELRALL